jgi:hypothetical protein
LQLEKIIKVRSFRLKIAQFLFCVVVKERAKNLMDVLPSATYTIGDLPPDEVRMPQVKAADRWSKAAFLAEFGGRRDRWFGLTAWHRQIVAVAR